MAASVRSVAFNDEPDNSIIVAKPTGTAVGDVLYGFHVQDDGTLASMAVTGTWATLVSQDHASEALNMKVYRRVVDGSEGSDFTFSASGGYNVAVIVCVQGADTTTPEDATALISPSGSASVNCVAPDISPAGSDSLLLTGHGAEGGGGLAVTMTPPSGMTEQADRQEGSFPMLGVASLELSSSGATGTKTATLSAAHWNIGASVVVKSAGGGGTSHTATVDDSAGQTDNATPTTTSPVVWSYGVKMGT